MSSEIGRTSFQKLTHSEQVAYLRRTINNYEKLVKNLRRSKNYYCPIISSKKIKKAILNRMEEIGVTPYEICIRADVSYASFLRNYIKKEDAVSVPSVRGHDLIRIADLIGIKIRIAVVMESVLSVDRTKLINEKFIPIGKRKKNKNLG